MPFDSAPVADPVTEILADMQNIIRERGWCQHRLTDDRGRVCLLGALNTAMVGTPHHLPLKGCAAYDRVAQRIRNAIPCPYFGVAGGIAIWNNQNGRTKEEVLALLETAKTKEVTHAV